MKLTSLQLSERVWQQTLPALRQRRLMRRTVLAGTATILLGVLAVVALPPFNSPAVYQWITFEAPSPPPAESSSLAVLVVDPSGTRFREYRPDQIAGAGLNFEFDLQPVITTTLFNEF